MARSTPRAGANGAREQRANRCATAGFALFLTWMCYVSFSLLNPGLIANSSAMVDVEYTLSATGIAYVASMTAAVLSPALRRGVPGRLLAAAAVVSAAGGLATWFGFTFHNAMLSWVSLAGGFVSGVGISFVALAWGDMVCRMSRRQVEGSVLIALLLVAAAYLLFLVFDGYLQLTMNVVCPAGTVALLIAARRCEAAGAPDAETPAFGEHCQDVARTLRSAGSLIALYALLWLQFSYFRVISTPTLNGEGFGYFLPFLAAAGASMLLLGILLARSRHVGFSLMFRWALPITVVSYGITLASPGNATAITAAYALNFIAMFGAQLICWMSAARSVQQRGLPCSVLFGALIAAEGLGVALGTPLALSLVKVHADASGISLILVAVAVLVAMVVGFNPEWSRMPLFPETGASGAAGSGTGAGADGAAIAGESGSAGTASAGASPGSAEGGAAGDEADIRQLCEEEAAHLRDAFGLTARETEIAALLLEGRNRPYVSEKLVIAINTVHAHVRSIYAKCGVHSQQELIEMARGERPPQQPAQR